jgi:hypothetical protein
VLPEYVYHAGVRGGAEESWTDTGLFIAVMNEQGEIVEGAEDPELGQDICTQIYTSMIRLNVRGCDAFSLADHEVIIHVYSRWFLF